MSVPAPQYTDESDTTHLLVATTHIEAVRAPAGEEPEATSGIGNINVFFDPAQPPHSKPANTVTVPTPPPPYTSTSAAIDETEDLSVAMAQRLRAVSSLDEETATRALNTVLDLPQNQIIIAESIKEFAWGTLVTRSAFEKISLLLRDFDASRFTTKQAKRVTPLRPRWDVLRKRYDDLLTGTHTEAVTIKLVCEDYIDVVLGAFKDPDMPVRDAKSELKTFTKRTVRAKGRTSSKDPSFDTLRGDVVAFQKSIESAFGSAIVKDSPRIPKLEEAVVGLRTHLRDQQAYMNFAKNHSSKPSLSVTGIGAVLVQLCPSAAFAVVGGMLVAANSANHMNVEQAKFTDQPADLAAHLHELKTQEYPSGGSESEDIQKPLAVLAASLHAIMTRLAAFTSFWNTIIADRDHIKQCLDSVGDAEPLTSVRKVLGDRIGEGGYLVLGRMMSIYVSKYTLSERSA